MKNKPEPISSLTILVGNRLKTNQRLFPKPTTQLGLEFLQKRHIFHFEPEENGQLAVRAEAVLQKKSTKIQ